MNERINALALQAGLKVEVMLDDSSRPVECYIDSTGSVPSVEAIHSLAGLIVKECVSIIGHGMEYTDYDDAEKSTIEYKSQNWCRDAIKEHFGIK